MRRSILLVLMLTSAGCVSPVFLDAASHDCATLKIRGATAATYQCGVPERRQQCVDTGAPTVVPYAGAYRTIRCSGRQDTGLVSR